MPTEAQNERSIKPLLIVLAWFAFTLAAIAVPPLFIVHIVVLVVLPFRRRQRKVYLEQQRNAYAEQARQRRGY
jgi:ABC-type bacteriocin/lantibiotic exporter with double-glycine peptidase domain